MQSKAFIAKLGRRHSKMQVQKLQQPLLTLLKGGKEVVKMNITAATRLTQGT